MKISCTKKEFIAAMNTFLRTEERGPCNRFLQKYAKCTREEAEVLVEKIFTTSGICLEGKHKVLRSLSFSPSSAFVNHNLRLAWEFIM
jgi:hypothetical protein